MVETLNLRYTYGGITRYHVRVMFRPQVEVDLLHLQMSKWESSASEQSARPRTTAVAKTRRRSHTCRLRYVLYPSQSWSAAFCRTVYTREDAFSSGEVFSRRAHASRITFCRFSRLRSLRSYNCRVPSSATEYPPCYSCYDRYLVCRQVRHGWAHILLQQYNLLHWTR